MELSSINRQKKRLRPISSQLGQQRICYIEKEHYFLAGHSGQDSAIFPTQVANHSAGFCSSWSPTELVIIIK